MKKKPNQSKLVKIEDLLLRCWNQRNWYYFLDVFFARYDQLEDKSLTHLLDPVLCNALTQALFVERNLETAYNLAKLCLKEKRASEITQGCALVTLGFLAVKEIGSIYQPEQAKITCLKLPRQFQELENRLEVLISELKAKAKKPSRSFPGRPVLLKLKKQLIKLDQNNFEHKIPNIFPNILKNIESLLEFVQDHKRRAILEDLVSIFQIFKDISSKKRLSLDLDTLFDNNFRSAKIPSFAVYFWEILLKYGKTNLDKEWREKLESIFFVRIKRVENSLKDYLTAQIESMLSLLKTISSDADIPWYLLYRTSPGIFSQRETYLLAFLALDRYIWECYALNSFKDFHIKVPQLFELISRLREDGTTTPLAWNYARKSLELLYEYSQLEFNGFVERILDFSPPLDFLAIAAILQANISQDLFNNTLLNSIKDRFINEFSQNSLSRIFDHESVARELDRLALDPEIAIKALEIVLPEKKFSAILGAFLGLSVKSSAKSWINEGDGRFFQSWHRISRELILKGANELPKEHPFYGFLNMVAGSEAYVIPKDIKKRNCFFENPLTEQDLYNVVLWMLSWKKTPHTDSFFAQAFVMLAELIKGKGLWKELLLFLKKRVRKTMLLELKEVFRAQALIDLNDPFYQELLEYLDQVKPSKKSST